MPDLGAPVEAPMTLLYAKRKLGYPALLGRSGNFARVMDMNEVDKFVENITADEKKALGFPEIRSLDFYKPYEEFLKDYHLMREEAKMNRVRIRAGIMRSLADDEPAKYHPLSDPHLPRVSTDPIINEYAMVKKKPNPT